MTEMFGEAWPPMSVPDLAPDDDDDRLVISSKHCMHECVQVYCYRNLDHPTVLLLDLISAHFYSPEYGKKNSTLNTGNNYDES